ncbi:carboxymuconolactone decarboxylase family protein [Pedobacter cryotolerans]|uniref:Carboxymuconolactone decarboxylase n=1 Tax=Pedobacter cryotolerans TaxID=2571270 RepID=A0A4U1C9U0_9SPHI|nr:carboxymuconolactone decarboxylase family protein [Pedobacter cryotolerans]TKC01546.1 carboxymuconolactone decarboxylase [Pedobacter cryotolerans]
MKFKIFTSAMLLFIISFSFMANGQQMQVSVENLSAKEKGLITISAFAAKGDLKNLETSMHAALDAKLSVNEAKEAMMHLYAYAGFPRSLRGLQTLMKVVADRKTKGLNDLQGPVATVLTDTTSKYERGKQNLEKLTGVKEKGPKTGYAAFAPEIEVFLKEHLFADLFDRDLLSFLDRELVTISVIAGIGEAEPMLTSHMNICLNLGLSQTKLQEFVKLIQLNLGEKHGAAAQNVLNHVLKNYNTKKNN